MRSKALDCIYRRESQKIIRLGFIFLVLFIASSGKTLLAQTILINTENNTSCGIPNGSASASVAGTTQGYSFEWHTGADETGPLVSVSPSITNLSAGLYSVKVSVDSTGITFGHTSAVILNIPNTPHVIVQVISNLTSCISPNGSLSAVVQGNSSDYTYAWYAGSTNAGPVISTNPSFNKFSAGVYTILVTNKISSCQALVSTTISDQRIFPVVSVQVLSQATSCRNPNGSLKAIVSGSASNYIFGWFRGTGTTGSNFSINQTINNQPAGTYTVEVMPRTSTCKTTVTATLADVSIQVTSNNTSCISGLPNGALHANVSGPVSNYLFTWFKGSTDSGSSISTSQMLDHAGAGIYTLRALNKFTSCQYILNAAIVDEIVFPTVSLNVTSNVTFCNTPNGSLAAVVAPGPSSAYAFEWFRHDDISTELLPVEGAKADQLQTGQYSVIVTNNNTHCKAITNATILDEIVLPLLSIQVVANDSSCTLPNGMPTGSLDATTNGPATNYTFSWFRGAVTTAEPVLSIGSKVIGLVAGVYTVKVSDKNTGCTSLLSEQVLSICDSVSSSIRMARLDTNETLTETSCISFYPNPTQGLIWINSDSTSGYVILTDSDGRIVYRKNRAPFHEPFAIDLSREPSGLYNLMIASPLRVSNYHIVKE